MKRLFVLRKHKNGAVILNKQGEPFYFDSKMAAKTARNAIGGDTVVSYGRDHRLYKGE